VIVIRHSKTGGRVREYRNPNARLVTGPPEQRACKMEKEMIKSGLLTAALVAAAMIATPAMAYTGAVTSRHLAANANPGVALGHPVEGSVGMRTPHVGAHAAPASAGTTCDVGDNERVC
jgi:hypothetical protein